MLPCISATSELLHMCDVYLNYQCALQSPIVQALASDLTKVEQLVEEAVRQLSAAATSSSIQPLDALTAMEAMNDAHVRQMLPQVEAASAQFEELAAQCMDCKVCAPVNQPAFHCMCNPAVHCMMCKVCLSR